MKLTKAQQAVMDEAMRYYNDAQTDFETWFMTSKYCNGTNGPEYKTFRDALEDQYLWFAKRDCPKDVEGYMQRRLEHAKKMYDLHRQGIISSKNSSNTLRALERKGLIEIIEDGKDWFDTYRLTFA